MKNKTLILFLCFFITLLFFVILYPEYINIEDKVYIPISKPENKISVFVVGDIMLDRQVRLRMNQFGFNYVFASTTEVIKNADISAGNLEGVITNFDSVSSKDNSVLKFTFDPQVKDILKNVGFDALSQANNHNDDFGNEGISKSYNFLESADIKPFGDYFNKDDKVAAFEKNGFKIAFIGCNEFGGGIDNIFNLVDKYKKENYFVVVMPHFGIEYEHYPTSFQKKNFEKMIDMGADIVIGSHPHVIQGVEIYNKKPIFYSLGNFIFDQNFSYDTTHAITLEIVKTNDKEKIMILPISINDSEPSFEEGTDKQKMLDFMASISDFSLKEQIQDGEIDL